MTASGVERRGALCSRAEIIEGRCLGAENKKASNGRAMKNAIVVVVVFDTSQVERRTKVEFLTNATV